jgi:hypothetical protein
MKKSLPQRIELRSRTILIVSTLVASWLGMQAVHELGHALGAWSTGGEVSRVVLHPLAISRTEVSHNPSPGVVVWAGPIVGVLLPIAVWGLALLIRMPGAFVLRFFAGFCLVVNGLYIGLGSFGRVGDCREMLLHGSHLWQLWLFGLLTVPAGFWLWHGEGRHFGLGRTAEPVSPSVAYGSLLICVLLLVLGLSLGR